ncbi:hypothetical protein NB724_002142 [Pantoea ananatis]|uniref:Uncharacterized protein n=1 Tax=Pantoea ananas TaxID=553 RepID=A0AAJ1D000_PANAN|nr:hypothetical protein [Pantoea ananatis]MCW0316991.1 hypothetical protein [Pantoea ananatis]MCW0331337.1 hypothetical protein [Pantoea ananatis]MCW0334808.1 hypothetical protein [Pantoea ananatis]MCW0339255.1 hypothetical protein [Pantoea ananatis]
MEPVGNLKRGYPIFLWITGLKILFIIESKLG